MSGWRRVTLPDGSVYYHNKITLQSSWDPPDAEEDEAAEGWLIAFDAEGDAYYYHSVTGQTQWEKPVVGVRDEDGGDDGMGGEEQGQFRPSGGEISGNSETQRLSGSWKNGRGVVGSPVAASDEGDEDEEVRVVGDMGSLTAATPRSQTAAMENMWLHNTNPMQEKEDAEDAARSIGPGILLCGGRTPRGRKKDKDPSATPTVTPEMERFAVKRFVNVPKKSVWNRIFGAANGATGSDAWVYASKPLSRPVLSPSSPAFDTVVKNVSLAVLVFCGDKKPKEGKGGKESSSSTSWNKAVNLDEELARKVFESALRQHEQFPLLKDEILLCICRQMNGNPDPSSRARAFLLMIMAVHLFCPTDTELLETVSSFLMALAASKHTRLSDAGCEHDHRLLFLCNEQLQLAFDSRLQRESCPTRGEIESYFQKLPDVKPVFYTCLQDYMRWEAQAGLSSNDGVPRILSISMECLSRLNAKSTNGLFRLPGSQRDMENIVLEIQRTGNFESLVNCSDIHTTASLMRFWLRTLAEPLIPVRLYDSCIAASTMGPQACISIVERDVPEPERVCLRALVRFLQTLGTPEVVKKTQMSIENIAMIFCPNLLRNPYASGSELLTNSFGERSFMQHLLKSW
jgi:hypothetical protein